MVSMILPRLSSVLPAEPRSAARDRAADRGCRLYAALPSSRGARRRRGICLPKTLPHRPISLDQGLARVSGRPPTTESLVEANVADEALEPRDKGLPGVRIPSPWDYQGEHAGQRRGPAHRARTSPLAGDQAVVRNLVHGPIVGGQAGSLRRFRGSVALIALGPSLDCRLAVRCGLAVRSRRDGLLGLAVTAHP
jgi:hypothetical protein